MARTLLTDDDRRLLLDLLTARIADAERHNDRTTAASHFRLLGKLKGSDKRVVIESDAAVERDRGVEQAVEHGC
jgi:hypothetical protein